MSAAARLDVACWARKMFFEGGVFSPPFRLFFLFSSCRDEINVRSARYMSTGAVLPRRQMCVDYFLVVFELVQPLRIHPWIRWQVKNKKEREDLIV